MEAFIPSSSHSNCVDLCSPYESFVKDVSPFRAKGMLPGLSVLSGGWKVWEGRMSELLAAHSQRFSHAPPFGSCNF